MGGRRKTTTLTLKEKSEPTWSVNCSLSARNMPKADIAAVIFGCKHSTIKECLFKQLFGLPAAHFAYVKKVTPGLVLFLFNYSDRTLHGIFEAVSPGQMNINPYAWTTDGTELTPYPAQVRVRIRKRCQPLSEEQFGPILADNYFDRDNKNLFWFELDRHQTKKLSSLFSPAQGNASSSSSRNTSRWNALFGSQQAGDQTEIGFGQTSILSAWDDTPLNLEDSVGIVEGNSQVNCQQSYSSVVTNKTLRQTGENIVKLAPEASSCGTDPMNSHLEPCAGVRAMTGSQKMTWISLFKTPATSEATKNDETEVLNASNMEDDSQKRFAPCTDTESSHSLEAHGDEVAARNYNEECTNFEPDQAYEEGEDSLQENMDCGLSCFSSHISGQTQSSEVSLAEFADEIYNHLIEAAVDENPDHKFSSRITNQEEHHHRDISHAFPEVHFEDRSSLVVDMVRRISSDFESLVIQLMHEIDGLKSSQLKQFQKVNSLEKQLVESKLEIQQLKENQNNVLQGGSCSPLGKTEAGYDHLSQPYPKTGDSVLIVGGYDGSSWLSSLESYFPSHDTKKFLSPMTFARSYSSAASLNGQLYLLGGVDGDMWYDTVESYDPTSNQWVTRPPLNQRKGSLAAASLCDKIFAVGGGNGSECFADVEMLDLNIGRWLSIPSMQHKRFAPAAAELNNALYVVGGYDGRNYLRSVERLDPREHVWTGLGSLSTRRGCHSLLVLNEKLYALGGYDGDKMVPTVEVFDPRFGAWMVGESMNEARGYSGAFVIGEKLYVVGGVKANTDVSAKIECYEDGCGWEMTNLKAVGKRCFFSALVI